MEFSRHFDGKRFYNPDAPQALGFLDVLRWKLTSRPEPSPRFISDVEPSIPPRRVEGSGLRVTLVNHSTVLLQQRGVQHFDGPDLVRTSQPCVVGRSAAPEKTGSSLGGSAAHRRRADQPQSLRPPGSADAAAAGGARRFHVHRSGWRGSVASLGEHRARARVGLGRVVVARGLHHPLRPGSAFLQPGNSRPQHDPVVRVRDRMPGTDSSISRETPLSAVISPGFGKSSDRRDLALLPIGAYEPRWFMSPVHMAPDEAVRAHQILGARTSIAIHHGTFQLADEGIDTPKKQLLACAPHESFLVLEERPIRRDSMTHRQAHARAGQHRRQFARRARRVIPRLRSAGRGTRTAADSHQRSHLRRAVRSRVRPRPRAGIWARERRGARHHTRLGVFPRFEASARSRDSGMTRR